MAGFDRGNVPRRTVAFLLGCVCLLGLLGCGQHPPVAAVRGTVTFEAKPVIAGRVLFLPIGGGKQGLGTIHSDGTFELSTFGTNDGALVGRHYAILVNVQLPGGSSQTLNFEISHDLPLVVEADKTNDFHIELTAPDWKSM